MPERIPEYPVLDLILNRQSQRAMSGKGIARKELFSLFEAAKWAPSSFNAQPWRFVFAQKENTAQFAHFLSFLTENNQVWAKNAAALIVLCSKKTLDNGKENTKHVFDAGAAWENLALEGKSRGLVLHACGGFDAQKAEAALHIPSGYAALIMIVVGKPGNVKDLPGELQKREQPTQRKLLQELVFEHAFGRQPEGEHREK